MLEWLKALLAGGGQGRGTVTRTCKRCGRTFTLPEEVQHWPDLCQACRAASPSAETVTRACRRCGRQFTFASSEARWPKYCPDCRAQKNGHK